MLKKPDRVVYKEVLFKRYKQRGHWRNLSCDNCFWLKYSNCTKPSSIMVNCLDLDTSEYYYRPCYYDN